MFIWPLLPLDEEWLVVMKHVKKFWSDESGATAIEYGLIAALVCLGAGGMMAALGTTVQDMYNTIGGGVAAAPGA